MKFTVREVTPRLERDALVRLLNRHLAPDIDNNRFDWLYFRNPHGLARVWALEYEGELVGAGAAIPKNLRISGSASPIVGCIFGDFCVASNYRSIGPALQLQRACLQAVDDGWARVAYDLPSGNMMAVYRRMGIRESGKLVRMAKPLRINREVAQQIQSATLANLVSQAGNAALRLRDRIRSISSDLDTRNHEETFGPEFTQLFEHVGKNENWCVERSAAYLNWRFREHPITRYRTWTSRRKGHLEGYAITQRNRLDVQIVELCTQAPEVLQSLVVSVIDSARAERANTLSMPVLAGHRHVKELRELGFQPRESAPVIAYGAASWTQSGAWLSEGDRDS
jgi:hypothetical protein